MLKTYEYDRYNDITPGNWNLHPLQEQISRWRYGNNISIQVTTCAVHLVIIPAL